MVIYRMSIFNIMLHGVMSILSSLIVSSQSWKLESMLRIWRTFLMCFWNMVKDY